MFLNLYQGSACSFINWHGTARYSGRQLSQYMSTGSHHQLYEQTTWMTAHTLLSEWSLNIWSQSSLWALHNHNTGMSLLPYSCAINVWMDSLGESTKKAGTFYSLSPAKVFRDYKLMRTLVCVKPRISGLNPSSVHFPLTNVTMFPRFFLTSLHLEDETCFRGCDFLPFSKQYSML